MITKKEFTMCNDALVFNNKPKAIELEAGKKYLMCSCGKAAEGVFCDGSHKGTECKPKPVTVEKTKQYHICMCKSSDNFPFCDGTHSRYSDEEVAKGVHS